MNTLEYLVLVIFGGKFLVAGSGFQAVLLAMKKIYVPYPHNPPPSTQHFLDEFEEGHLSKARINKSLVSVIYLAQAPPCWYSCLVG